MHLPTFIVFGSRKAGTSSIYNYLEQHPQVFMSRLKGTRFFQFDPERPELGQKLPVKTLEDYATYFRDGAKQNAKATGEISPSYLTSRGAAQRIHQTLPNIKLVASLRNPVDRAYSQYQMDMRGLSDPNARVEFNSSTAQKWIPAGRYASHLQRFYDLFNREQIQIHVFEDWIAKPAEMTASLYRHIGVDEGFKPDFSVESNKGGQPKSEFVKSLLQHRKVYTDMKRFVPKGIRTTMKRLRNANMTPAPKLDPALKAELLAQYTDDIAELEDLLRRDLDVWRPSC